MNERLPAILVLSSLVITATACGSSSAKTSQKSTTTASKPASTTAPLMASTSASSVTPTSPATTSANSTSVAKSSSSSSVAGGDSADVVAIDATRALFAKIGPNDPGCTVAVSRGGKLVFSEAYGARRLNPTEPITTDTVVDIGSTSKQFTATAILFLEKKGVLDLDAPVSTYLPGVAPWAASVTTRQMMHHQSGIPDYIELLSSKGFETTGRSTDADALAALAETTALKATPGTTFDYSNSNYFLMGQIVLRLTGKNLGRFLADEVFTPLGLAMKMDPLASIPGKAMSYTGKDAARQVADSLWEQLGDGGIQTTPTELVKWASQYWAPTVGGSDINVRRLEQSVEDSQLGGRYGAGILERQVDGTGRVLAHSGGWGGFVTFFAVIPDRQFAIAGTCTSPDTIAALGFREDLDILRPWIA